MRRINRSQVLNTLRDAGPMSRPALSKATGLSKITVDAVAGELLNEARLVEAFEQPTGVPGRRARLLYFRPESAHVAAIDIGATRARVGIADLSGTFVAQENVTLTGIRSGAQVVEEVCAALLHTVRAAGLNGEDVRAVCIATPGIVDPVTQRVTLAPQLPDWDEVDLVQAMSFLGDAPVHVENEVHLAVLGEQWRGAARGFSDIAYVHLGVGVGLGIVLDGKLVRGAHGGAGEIGYLPSDATPHETGSGGAFEWLVGGAAYTRAANELIASGRGDVLQRLAADGACEVDARVVYRAAEVGDPGAMEIIERILSITATGVASVATVLDPALVIVGGGIAQAGTWMLDRLAAKVRALTPLHSGFALAGLGEDAALIGATRRAIEACEHELIDVTR